MKDWVKKHLRVLVFTLSGVVAGLLYHLTVGCSTGSCVISENPFSSMLYMGLIGLVLSGLFEKGGKDRCNM